MKTSTFLLAILIAQATPRQQPGADITLYAPEDHDLYDGRFIITGGGFHHVGTLAAR